MKTTQLCPQCGQTAPPDALLGLCPRCMLKAGAPGTAKPTIAVSPDAFVEGPETETKEFVPGTRIGYIGDYELLEEIARGGMGVVYKARQSSLKRIVAVKTIRAAQLASEVDVRRFHTEAEAAAQLQHPNIVAIHEIGEHQGQHYFSMDFVEGRNLAQVANGKPVPERSAAEWLKTIAGAVQFAHQRGVLHRDLKPQNIMVDSAGRPRVMDFGLAKTLGSDSSVTKTGTVMGSPSYMSPEQALGRNDLVGPSSDVYSLGAILYELLTGRPPFRGKSMMETLSQVVNDEPPPPRSLHAETSVDLESICLKCLEKDQARRYPTARELEADLGRFLDGEPVQAKPANALRKTMSWFRRHPWVFSGVVSVLMLAMTGLAYGLWEQTRFLIWSHAHPGVAISPGPQFYGLNAFGNYSNVIIVAIIFCVPLAYLIERFKARPTRGKVFSLLNPGAPGLRMVAPFCWLASCCGIWMIVFNFGDAIRRYVWDDEGPSLSLLALVLWQVWMGVKDFIQKRPEQLRTPVGPTPETEASPRSHSNPKPGLIGLVIFQFAFGLALLSVPEMFSRDNLIWYVIGFAVPATSWFGLFLWGRKFYTGPRWTKFLVRICYKCLATTILVLDFIAVAVGPNTSSPSPNFPHVGGVFLFGLVAGGFAVLWTGIIRNRQKRMTPELIEPIHVAIFAGRTDAAVQLYQAATGEKAEDKWKVERALEKMEKELSWAHPEKFAEPALERANRKSLRRFLCSWAWPYGLAPLLLLPGRWHELYFWALSGVTLGAWVRTMRFDEWREWRRMVYWGMHPIFKILIWIMLPIGAWLIVFFIASSFHPGLGAGVLVSGLIPGWLLSHWWLTSTLSKG